ncbi:MAG: hypothetical protein N2482_00745 [Patescibacteria group bacterium]|nr:hypothetical protein [Patescibacteria group bacterium]
MIDLDNIKDFLKSSDNQKVVQSLDNLNHQIEQSFIEVEKTSFPYFYKKANNIVICGMGGSRFPALIIKELFKDELSLPIIINDDYLLPGFVNKKTLVILSSYSGTTEEVLINAQKSLNKKALIFAITSGNQLAKICLEKKLPVYVFRPLYNPSNQPRIGFGYSIGALLSFLIKLGFLNVDKKKVMVAIKKIPKLTASFKTDIETKKNPAKQLALSLYQKYPYFTVAEFLTGWGNALANQTNETAKNISIFRVIPELNHHLMEGLKHPQEIKKLLVFVFFYSSLYSSSIQKRFLITKEVVEKNRIKTLWLTFSGKDKIEQVFEAMALGSYFTFYLSLLYQENPSLIPYVDYFKKRLKEI